MPSPIRSEDEVQRPGPLERCGRRLVGINESARSSKLVAWLIPLAAFCFAFAVFYAHTKWKHSLDGPPVTNSDDPDYDSMGWELSKGRGFSIDVTDPQFLSLYGDEDQTRFQSNSRYGPATYRPPLYPVILAAGNRLFGRQFWWARLVNFVTMSIVCAMIALMVHRLVGPIPALITPGLFVLLDWRVRDAAREIMTESVSCLFIAATAWSLHALLTHVRMKDAILTGLWLGLATLTRTIFAPTIPIIGILLIATLWKHGRWQALKHSAVMILIALVCIAPWTIRNITLLDRFMPLGTQGQMQLSAGYSEIAFSHQGVWHNMDQTDETSGVIPEGVSGIERELQYADWSSQRAFAWIKANPQKLPLLFLLKIFHEFRAHGSGEMMISAFALIGLLALWPHNFAKAAVIIIAAGAVTIGLTWSVSGRFLVPLLFLFHVPAAIGLWFCVVNLTAGRKQAVTNLKISRFR